MNDDLIFMEEALKEANIAYMEDEVPVGCVVVLNGEIIGRGHNKRESTKKVYSHAEIEAIINAGEKVGSYNLEGATIYSTLEPCPMCSYAIIDAHIKRLVYGAKDPKRGAITLLDIFNKNLGSKVEIYGNILEGESSNLLKTFFKNKR